MRNKGTFDEKIEKERKLSHQKRKRVPQTETANRIRVTKLPHIHERVTWKHWTKLMIVFSFNSTRGSYSQKRS